jgi:hypothetical protein
MNSDDPVRELPPYLVETADLIRATFPDVVPEEAYYPLLTLLVRGMSQRALARVISYCTGKTYIDAYHDVLGAGFATDPGPPGSPAYEKVARALREHGYDAWLAKSDAELTAES